MSRIDLVTVIHPEDVHRPKNKYTFMAPANSGITKGEYVLVKVKKEEVLAYVVSVLPDIDEDDSTMNYIRSVSSLGDRILKPVIARLVREDITYDNRDIMKYLSTDRLDEYLAQKKESKMEQILTRKERLKNFLEVGTEYYSIEQGFSRENGFFLYAEEYTFCDSDPDYARIEEENVFFNLEEVNQLITIIMKHSDSTKRINVHEEIARIL